MISCNRMEHCAPDGAPVDQCQLGTCCLNLALGKKDRWANSASLIPNGGGVYTVPSTVTSWQLRAESTTLLDHLQHFIHGGNSIPKSLANPMKSINLIRLSTLLSLVLAQQVFINQIPAYSSLDACAEPPLSSIVRDMYSGCGDGGRTTSYSCFCTESSSHMASVISTAVLAHCPGSTTDAASATTVFHAYCQLNATQTSSTIPKCSFTYLSSCD